MVSSIAGNFVGWQGGILMSIIAFSIVFLVIAGLMFMMMALKILVAVINPNKTPVASSGGGTSVSQSPKPGVTAAVRYETPSQDDDELIAVLSAAVAAAGGQAAAVLSYTPAAPAVGRSAVSMWRMTGILSNSRGLRD
ncbi:MAG: OadG family protein [Synergistaceae bacterium]|jgi:hypothetical protein|nr:OadG family protein [Synergistaceae bacterium]